MKLLAFCATHGRHTQLERSLGLFLNQDYQDKKLLIYQNSPVQQRLFKDSPEIILVNNHIDPITNAPFTNLGAIYNACLDYIENEDTAVTFWDDDDLFNAEHLSSGISGLLRGGKSAYKPAYSYYRSDAGIELAKNVLEPSIFVTARHLRKWKFALSTGDQHLQWVSPLVQEHDISIEENGRPTLMYNWSSEDQIFKTSGDFLNPDNFQNFQKYSQDHGDQIINPLKTDQLINYLSLFPAI